MCVCVVFKFHQLKLKNNFIFLFYRKETDKIEKGKALREASKRIQLGPESLPSICFYTLLNSGHTAICTDICDDSTLLAVGFSNSNIKVWTLTPVKLRGMKSAEKLQDIDREAGMSAI